MAKTIYIVTGTSGDYSDRDEWPVCAYEDEALAQQHAIKATEGARVGYEAVRQLREDWDGVVDYPTGSNPYDPHENAADYGTSYFIATCEVRTALPPAN
jgi:hypothetical protein